MIAALPPLSEVAPHRSHDQRIGPRRDKVDNNRGPRGSPNGWLHAGGSHDVQSRATYAAHPQDEYPIATVPAAHRSGLDGGVHTRLLEAANRRPSTAAQAASMTVTRTTPPRLPLYVDMMKVDAGKRSHNHRNPVILSALRKVPPRGIRPIAIPSRPSSQTPRSIHSGTAKGGMGKRRRSQ